MVHTAVTYLYEGIVHGGNMVDSLLSLWSISVVVKGQVFDPTLEPPQGAS